MIEITCNDRLGKKVRVKCNEDDTIGDLKKLIAAQTGTRADKIVLKKWYTIFKDHVMLSDYYSKPFDCVQHQKLGNNGKNGISNTFDTFNITAVSRPTGSDEIHDGMNLELYYQ